MGGPEGAARLCGPEARPGGGIVRLSIGMIPVSFLAIAFRRAGEIAVLVAGYGIVRIWI